jgi:hypothetical protein
VLAPTSETLKFGQIVVNAFTPQQPIKNDNCCLGEERFNSKQAGRWRLRAHAHAANYQAHRADQRAKAKDEGYKPADRPFAVTVGYRALPVPLRSAAASIVDGAISVSARQSLKRGIPQLIWGVFAIISGLEGYVMLSGGQLSMGVANLVICLGLTELTVYWRTVIYYFASSPAVLKVGVLMMLLFLGIMYSPLLTSREFHQQKSGKAKQFSD